MRRNFRNIKAWQRADDLALCVYSITRPFPKEELYGMTSQLRRAAVSAPANIAEGASREHEKEYLHSLNVASGSIAEIEYLLHLSRRIGYLKSTEYKRAEALRQETAKTLHGLINAVRREAGRTQSLS